MKKYQAILMLGAPGIGKSTYSKEIIKDGGYFMFSTGEMFRNLDPSTEIGAKVKEIINSGDLVDDETAVALAKETLNRYVSEGKFDPENEIILLDGIPRTIPQVEMVKEFLDIKQVVDYYVNNEQILIDRIMDRGEGRVDDSNEEIVRKRIDKYNHATAPLMQEYPEEIICKINGSQTILEVVAELKKKIYRKIKDRLMF